MILRFILIVLVSCVAAACLPGEEEKTIEVTVIVDGREEEYSFSRELTVDQLLASAQIELGPRDRASHPLVSQVLDGMLITIRRVHEKQECYQQEIDFQRRLLPKEGVAADGRELAQPGIPGMQEACYIVIYEDDVVAEQILVGSPTVLREPTDEIIYTGTTESVEPVAIVGRLSYINHNNPWTIKGNTVNKRPLTMEHNLDSLVFHQREDGARLIFSGETNEADDFFNELWLMETDGDTVPIRMTPTDVLFAEWRPRTGNVIAYSTGERSEESAGWKALNNLWLMTINLETGSAMSIEEVLPEATGGVYGWWGTHFAWSPFGDKMAWARPDGYGIVDFESKSLKQLAEYAVFHSTSQWVWLSPLSWSYDNQLIAAIVHGAPLENEPAETSPIFDITVSQIDGRFSTAIQTEAGMWAAPTYSPERATDDAEHSEGYLAWLQAREPHNSMSGEYNLVIADRDGSNQRRLFPLADEVGIRKTDFGLTAKDFAWSPDARLIALIYQGDLWLVNVETAVAHQITFDGASSHPVWTR